MSYTWSYPRPAVLHVRADTQRELCTMFVRLQEFYESPFPEIQGQVFTRDQFLARYAKFTDTSYFEDWHGFNVPGHIVRWFFKRFTDKSWTLKGPIALYGLSREEQLLDIATRMKTRFYLIGTHIGCEDALEHELCHARFYLDDAFANSMMYLLRGFRDLPEAAILEQWLLREGYDKTTMNDEMQAYLATSDEAYWHEQFPGSGDLPQRLWRAGAPFRERYESP